MDIFSGEDEIIAIQERLRELHWLKKKDEVEPGVLDELTVNAVIEFQAYVNAEFGIELLPVDPEEPVIDIDTLDLLMNTPDDTYKRPKEED